MTRNYDIILPLMFAVAVSTVFASILHRDGIYDLKLKERGIDLTRRRDRGKLTGIKVKDAMKPVEKLTTVCADLSLTEMGRLFHDSYHHGFAVLDGKGELYGIITLKDFHHALSRNPDVSALTVGDVCVRDVFTAFPDDSVEDVLTTFGALDVGRIPVVAPNNPRRLLGVLRWSDTVRSYSQVMLDLAHEPGTSLIRCRIREGDFAAGKPLRQLGLPADCVVNQIQRGKHLVVPRGDTVVQPGDILVVLSSRGDDEEISRLLRDGATR
jgi:CBS domain-containing protein